LITLKNRQKVSPQRLLWSNIQTEQGNLPIDELQLHLYDHHHHTEHLITQMGAGLVYALAWSLVSDKILFVVTESGNDEIWLTHRDGSALHQLTRNQWEWDKTPSSWSPDGQQIVFYSNRTVNNQLWLMNKDGTNQHLLLPDLNNSKRIIFAMKIEMLRLVFCVILSK
jgi:Tol biopolymer transport system component